MDNDPYGLEILSIYKYGSKVRLSLRSDQTHTYQFLKAMENSKEKLTVPRIEWLGLHCRDWHRFGISDDMLLPLADSDRKRGVDLLKRKHIRNETEWKYVFGINIKNILLTPIDALGKKYPGYFGMAEKQSCKRCAHTTRWECSEIISPQNSHIPKNGCEGIWIENK